MAVIIKVGEKANAKKVRLEIDARKSISGDVMVFDHGDIDIVLSPSSKKVIAFSKDILNDMVYGAQNRLFTHLQKRGIVIPESIRAGSFFGSFEAQIQQASSENINASKLALINISNFIAEERPYFESTDAIISMSDDELIHPDKADSTELGDVPQADQKGSIRPSYVRDSYNLNYMYTI